VRTDARTLRRTNSTFERRYGYGDPASDLLCVVLALAAVGMLFLGC